MKIPANYHNAILLNGYQIIQTNSVLQIFVVIAKHKILNAKLIVVLNVILSV